MLVDVDTCGLHVTDANTVALAAMVLQHPAFKGVLNNLPADIGTWAALTHVLCEGAAWIAWALFSSDGLQMVDSLDPDLGKAAQLTS